MAGLNNIDSNCYDDLLTLNKSAVWQYNREHGSHKSKMLFQNLIEISHNNIAICMNFKVNNLQPCGCNYVITAATGRMRERLHTVNPHDLWSPIFTRVLRMDRVR